MAPKRKMIKAHQEVDIYDSRDLGSLLSEISKFVLLYGEDSTFQMYDRQLYIEYLREETDAEYNKRIKRMIREKERKRLAKIKKEERLAKAEEKNRLKELELYEELKKKYG